MSTTAHYHVRGIDIDLAEMPIDLYNEIISLHGHHPKPDEPRLFTCLGNGKAIYVYRCASHKYPYLLRHYPRQSCGHSHVLSRMSDEHRYQAEYCWRGADSNGLRAQLEMSTGGGTRVDVGVYGAVNTGFEIQRAELSRAHAKQRATKSFGAGWPTAWIHNKEREPDWAGHVPTARLTVRDDWSSLPPPHTANVIIRKFWRERSYGSWRYESGPETITLDELSYLMPLGEIIPVAVGKRGLVVLAYRGAAEIIDSCTYPGASAWQPVAATPRYKRAPQRLSRPCPQHPVPQRVSVLEVNDEYKGGVIETSLSTDFTISCTCDLGYGYCWAHECWTEDRRWFE